MKQTKLKYLDFTEVSDAEMFSWIFFEMIRIVSAFRSGAIGMR